MAEDYSYGSGRYRDEYDDAAEDYEAGYGDSDDDAEYLDAADYGDHDDYGYEDDTDLLTDESVEDQRLLTGVVDEPVNDVLDDPAVNESPAYERIRRMKGSARARRKGNWKPPDLTGYGLPFFWPVKGPDETQGPARRRPLSITKRDVLFQVIMQPLVSCAELARILDLDEDVVKGAVQALQEEGLLRSVSFGCLMQPTARYWAAPGNVDAFPLSDCDRAVLSWHSDDGIGCLLKYDIPRVESVNQVAVRYARDGWALEGVAWVEGEAVQAVALYHRRGSPKVRSTVSFMWVGRWDTEQNIWERLEGLPAAVSRITQSGLSGSVALIGADRLAVTRALPMAVESLSACQVEPADVAAWAYAGGWQAASGASMLDGAAGQPFTPALAPVQLDRFVWPKSQRSLGKTRLASIINSCPWTRGDARTLYQTLVDIGEFPGCSIAHYAALAGRSDKDTTTRERIGTLLDLGMVREADRAGVANLGTPDKPEVFSKRGRGQMRYRVSLSPKGEVELAEKLAEKLAGKLAEKLAGKLAKKLAKKLAGKAWEAHTRPTANGMYRIMLDHGELSYREVVRRSGVFKIWDRLGDRLVHEDVLVDVLGRFTVMGGEVAPASRAITVHSKGLRIEPDGLLFCCSPVGIGYHYFELELSHLGPSEIRPRIEKYALRLTSYPLAVVCKTDRGARHFDRIGQELGVPVVATSILRLKKIGVSGPAWIHHGQEVFVTPVPCPPQPAAP